MKIIMKGAVVLALWMFGTIYYYTCNILSLCQEAQITNSFERSIVDENEEEIFSLNKEDDKGDLTLNSSNDEKAIIETVSNTFEIEESDNKMTIRFPYNSANPTFDRNIKKALDKVVKKLKKNKYRATITGYTDSQGSETVNMALGKKRAKRIADYIFQHNIRRSLVSVESEGENKPIADNATEEGRRLNRRVEIVFQ